MMAKLSANSGVVGIVLFALICGPVMAGQGIGESNIFSIDNTFDYSDTELPNESMLGMILGIMGFDSDPVNTATGNFYHDHTDLTIATRSMPFKFTRHYNSKDSSSGPLGLGWTHSYNIVLTDGLGTSGNKVSVRWGDGRTDYWVEDSGGGYDPCVPGLYDKLEVNGSGWKVTKKNLDVYSFDGNGRLQTIADKNGNAFTLGYGVSGELTTITDPAGRVVTLTYNPDGTIDTITDCATSARIVHFGYISGKLTHVTDVLGNTITYTYDGNGYLDSITDQRGVTTVANIYDTEGRVTQQTDGNNNVTIFTYGTEAGFNKTTITYPDTTEADHLHSENNLLLMIRYPIGSISYAYDADNNRTSIVSRNGNVTSFVYDARGNVISTTDPDDPCDINDGGITTVTYDDPCFPDLPTAKTDALGRATTWEYDTRGNCVREIDPNGFESTWTYNAFGQEETVTDKNGHTNIYTYDADGLLTEVINADGDHTWFGYDALWRLTQVTDGRGTAAGDPDHTTKTVYDPADRVIAVTGPITSQSYQYDAIGNQTRLTNGRGFITNFEYDNNSNLTRTERVIPSDPCQTTEFAYDQLNRRTSMTDPCGFITSYEYDALGRLIKETNPETDETTYIYDSHGNMLSMTDGSGLTITYEYDALNRRIAQYDEAGNQWCWQYDKLGNLTTHTDAVGNVTDYEYDPLNRLISVTDSENNVTEYTYDAIGNLIQIADGGERVITAKCYTSANRLACKTDGLGNTYTYDYDGAGNLISVTDPDLQTKALIYDNENRLTEVHYPDSSQATYSYDDNGNLLAMTDSTGTTTYTYDALDRLIASIDGFGKQVEYGYDLIGNRTSLTYPADSTNPARVVSYTYDTASRLDTIRDWDGRVWDYDVDGAGRITQLIYPNGTKKLQVYDPCTARLATLSYEKADTSPLLSYTYTRDAQGNPTGIHETDTLLPDLSTLFGNTAYTYDDDSQLTTATPATYDHDNRGNITTRNAEAVTTTFSYDYDNRLISQTTAGNTVQHTYDSNGNRIARDDNGTTTRYILDHGRDMSHVLCETDNSGEIIAYYIHGPTIVGRVAADTSVKYYHANHIGSVVALTDQAESITDRYAYTPFGTPAGSQGTTPNPFTYIGGLGVMADADGLYFMRARFYEPPTGRFLGKDPIEGTLTEPMTLHKYNYALNNAIRYSDPSGEAVSYKVTFGIGFLSGFTGRVLNELEPGSGDFLKISHTAFDTSTNIIGGMAGPLVVSHLVAGEAGSIVGAETANFIIKQGPKVAKAIGEGFENIGEGINSVLTGSTGPGPQNSINRAAQGWIWERVNR